jgi:hypothetical protein
LSLQSESVVATRANPPRPVPRPFASRPQPVLHGSPYPAFVGKALLAAAHVQVALWDRAMRRVEAEQQAALAAIVRHAAGTEFGRKYGFSRIRAYDDFARSVPVGDYDSFSPYIDRMRKGERDLLVPEFVTYYGNSSGSSQHGRSKFLPITERQISHQRRAGADTLMRYLAWAKDDSFTQGYTLGLVPPTTMKPDGPTLVTSNPALMVTRLPAFTRPVYLPDDRIRRIGDYETKLRAIAEQYVDWDVRSLLGTTCWFPVMFERLLEVARKQGRKADHVSDLWPNLRALIGGGVAAKPYLPILRKLMGRDDFTLIDSYNATEGGIYAASDFSGKDGMLMLPHRGTFFEFLPVDASSGWARGDKDRDKEKATFLGKRVPLWGVKPGQLYSIVVTTVSGLYAYEIGDIVRFASIDPLRIEFAGRLSGCLSVTQELTTHVEIEGAVAHAIAQCPCRTVDFGAAADVGADGHAKSRYVLFVEFDEGAEPKSLADFTAAFDQGMCAQNRVYREHRTGDVAIVAPRVVPLVRGGAQRFLDATTRGNVQGKFPRILDEGRRDALFAFASASSASS